MKEILLTQGQFALVDDDDFGAVSQFKWHAVKKRGTFYAARNVRKSDGRRTLQLLHQFLMPGVPMVDHEDGYGLNNRRYNLRPCTKSQNNHNARKRAGTSQFKGVSWCGRAQKWRAQIMADKRYRHLGIFASEADAARAYDTAAKKLHKDFARLNFPA